MTGAALAYAVARFCSIGIWLMAGFYKAWHFEATVEEMAERHHIPWPRTVLVLVLALEFVGSLCLVADYCVWLVALAWIAFAIPATWLYHLRFMITPARGIDFVQYLLAWKNLSIAGGLIALILLDPSRPAWLFPG